MKTTPRLRVKLLAALGLGFLLLGTVWAQDIGNIRVVRLARVEGQVLISYAGTDTWEEAAVNLALQQGDRLATQDGFAGIEFESGATAYLAENSILQFAQLDFSNAGRATSLFLSQGAGTFYANLTAQDSFLVRTSIFDVSIPERAEFRIDAFRDGAAAEVFLGNVSVTSMKGSTDLTKGQSVAVHENDLQDFSIIGRLPNEDAFDQWVTQEGEIIRSGNKNSLTYVNSPNTYGLSDLSIYGTWASFSPYGFIWRPFSTGLSWTPYLNGSWRLDPLLGWIWVSSEPWGWMPYHFGTWLLSPLLGWVWVPGGAAGLRQWQPSRVNWVRTGDQIGWVAKSPDDREGAPTNIANGVMKMAGKTPEHTTGRNEIVVAKDLRNITPLKQPPPEFASGFSRGLTGPLGRSTIHPDLPRTPPSNDSIVLDHQTHVFINRDTSDENEVQGNIRNRPPVPPAALMPHSGTQTELPRGLQIPAVPPNTRVNRAVISPPAAVNPGLHGNLSRIAPVPPPLVTPRPVLPPHVNVPPPVAPKAVAPSPPPGQPAPARGTPAQNGSAPRASTRAPQAAPSSPPDRH